MIVLIGLVVLYSLYLIIRYILNKYYGFQIPMLPDRWNDDKNNNTGIIVIWILLSICVLIIIVYASIESTV